MVEKKIRQYLVDNNYVDCVIQLPSNLFFGASIATCILVLKKSKTDNKTLFIDASEEFVKITNNNKLTAENIQKILDAYTNRENISHLSTLVDNEEIANQDYNLSVSTYVEKQAIQEQIDITSLNLKIEEIVQKQNVLRSKINKIIKDLE